MKEQVNAWGIEKATGLVIHAKDAVRGNNCLCIYCGEPLQARKGQERQPHFKHITGADDKRKNEEWQTHLLAMQISWW